MWQLQEINPNQFVELVEPLLARAGFAGSPFAAQIDVGSRADSSILRSNHRDARKIALLALAWWGQAVHRRTRGPVGRPRRHDQRTGRACHVGHLVSRRQNLRGQPPRSPRHEALRDKDFNKAVELFSQAIRSDPNFSEAYNQRAIAYFLTDDFKKSIADCDRTIRRMPCHFGIGPARGTAICICMRPLRQWNPTRKPWQSILTSNACAKPS